MYEKDEAEEHEYCKACDRLEACERELLTVRAEIEKLRNERYLLDRVNAAETKLAAAQAERRVVVAECMENWRLEQVASARLEIKLKRTETKLTNLRAAAELGARILSDNGCPFSADDLRAAIEASK